MWQLGTRECAGKESRTAAAQKALGQAAEHTLQHLRVTKQDRLCTANHFLHAQFMLCNTNPDSLDKETKELLSRSLLIKGVESALTANCCCVLEIITSTWIQLNRIHHFLSA